MPTHRYPACYFITTIALLVTFNLSFCRRIKSTKKSFLPLSQYLWSYKHKEGDLKPFRGGRTYRQKAKNEYKAKHKTMRYMNYREMGERKNILISYNDKATAIKYLEKMIPLCDDLEEKGTIILELADFYFDCGNFKNAELRYKEFYTFYPGNKNIEYAHYKAILCSFQGIYSADRDQTKTKETLTLTADFLQNNERFTTYRKDVLSVQLQCQKRIFDSEASIFNFYLNRCNFKAAQMRLEKLEKDFSTVLAEAPAQIELFKKDFIDKQIELGIPNPLHPATFESATFSTKMSSNQEAEEQEGKIALLEQKSDADEC